MRFCWATARSTATRPQPSIRSAIYTRRNSVDWPLIWECPNKYSPSIRPPTFGRDKTDEGELGFSYLDADRLLVLMVDHRWQRSKLEEAGFPADLIDRIRTVMDRNCFKRRLPLIARLSPCETADSGPPLTITDQV